AGDHHEKDRRNAVETVTSNGNGSAVSSMFTDGREPYTDTGITKGQRKRAVQPNTTPLSTHGPQRNSRHRQDRLLRAIRQPRRPAPRPLGRLRDASRRTPRKVP